MFHALLKRDKTKQHTVMTLFIDPEKEAPLAIENVMQRVQAANKFIVVNMESYSKFIVGRGDLVAGLFDFSEGKFNPKKKIEITECVNLSISLPVIMDSFISKCKADLEVKSIDFLTFIIVVDDMMPDLDYSNHQALATSLLPYLRSADIRAGFAKVDMTVPEFRLTDYQGAIYSNRILIELTTAKLLNTITGALTEEKWKFYEKHQTILLSCKLEVAEVIVAHLQEHGITTAKTQQHQKEKEVYFVHISPVTESDPRFINIPYLAAPQPTLDGMQRR